MESAERDAGPGREKARGWVWLAVGIGCAAPVMVVAVMGMARGHTTVTRLWFVPLAILVIGELLVLRGTGGKTRIYAAIFYNIFVVAYVLFPVLVQGRYGAKGKEHYRRGQYEDALEDFENEAGAWYLRWQYNRHEAKAMAMAAKSHCQLGNFDEAREIYWLIMERYPGEAAEGARADVARLEDGLAVVGDYKGDETEGFGGVVDLYGIAMAYHYDLNCPTKAMEVYRRIVDMEVPEDQKETARFMIEEIMASWLERVGGD